MDNFTLANGFTVRVTPDSEPLNPRTEWEHLGKMVCFHKRYTLGDKHDLRSGDFDGWDAVREYLEGEQDAAVVLPLYLMDHSGITMSTNPFGCRWDSGQVGFIYMDHAKVRDEFGGSVSRATACLEAEVEEYDRYLRGDVYTVTLLDPDGNVVDCVGGFFGEDAAKEQVEDFARPYGGVASHLPTF